MAESNYRPVQLCGMAAVQACFQHRPKAIKRLWLAEPLEKPLGPICRWMAAERLSYSTVDERELARVAGHAFHGGVIAATERPPLSVPKPSDYAAWHAAGERLLFLDDITEPLHIGAAVRVAAALGLQRVFFSGAATAAAFSERAWSTAGGALDMVRIYDAGNLPVLLRHISDRFCVIAFTRPGGRRVDDLKPIRVPGRPLAIVIGDTDTGVSSDVVGKCEHLLHIPGAEGSTLFTAADTAAFGLPWLLGKERKNDTGFLAAKRARKEKLGIKN